MKASKTTEKEPMKPARQLATRPAPCVWLGILTFGIGGLLSQFTAAEQSSWQVEPVPKTLREQLELAPFYQKHITVAGFPIVGSAEASDHALREAAWIVRHVVGERDDILQAMAANKVRLVVMAWDEYTTDVPEHSQLLSKVFWDRRARGLGATLHNPVVSCAEENLLCFPNDPYSTENILIHEFAHAIHGTAGQALGADFDLRLKAAYRNATENGLFKDTYAGSNSSEYWAEAVQDWFDNNRENDSLHNYVNTRAELKALPCLSRRVDTFPGVRWQVQSNTGKTSIPSKEITKMDTLEAIRTRRSIRQYLDKPVPQDVLQQVLS
jgi:hypothetical protein